MKLLAVLILTLIVPGSAAADPYAADSAFLREAAGSLSPGMRIRITAPHPLESRFTAWFAGFDSDSALLVRLDRGGPAVRVYPRQIGRVEVPVGRNRHWPVGAVMGCIMGTAVAYALAPREDPVVELPYVGATRFQGLRGSTIAVGSVAGLVAGGVIGYFIRSTRWAPVAETAGE